MTNITVPWAAWYGDTWYALPLPGRWQISTCWPVDAPDIGATGIEHAMDNPIDSPPIEDIVRGKRTVAIAVDDLSRPTRGARILPPLLDRLVASGIDLDDILVIAAAGTHHGLLKPDLVKKLGRFAADRLDIRNHHPYENTVHLGATPHGTPVHINRYFAQADVRITIGSILPHGAAGFSGGAKMVMPGVAGIETIVAMHTYGRLQMGIDRECNEWREEIELIAREFVGVDWIINSVPNSQRGIAGLFVGDLVGAHRAGIAFGRQVFATPLPQEPADIVILNCYPKDTLLTQHRLVYGLVESSPRPPVKPGGTLVLTTASSEGRGLHGVYGPGMRLDAGVYSSKASKYGEKETIFFSPNVSTADAEGQRLFRRWEDLVTYLESSHAGQSPTVAVFPCAPMQLGRAEQG